MQLDKDKIVTLIKASIDIRNACKTAIAANDHILEVPAVAATDRTPAKAAWKKSTGQLASAANNAFVTATNLISWLKMIGGDDVTVRALEQSLNAPAPKAQAGPANVAAPSKPS